MKGSRKPFARKPLGDWVSPEDKSADTAKRFNPSSIAKGRKPFARKPLTGWIDPEAKSDDTSKRFNP